MKTMFQLIEHLLSKAARSKMGVANLIKIWQNISVTTIYYYYII